jgi:hypothetical protein
MPLLALANFAQARADNESAIQNGLMRFLDER